MKIRGKVRWFNEIQGYGVLITPDGKEVFVHYKDIEGEGYKTLSENEDIVFQLKPGEKNLQAHKVEKQNSEDNINR